MTINLTHKGVTFRVGDRVQIERTVPSYDPSGMGTGKIWGALWNEMMNDTVGRVGIIEELDEDGVRIRPELPGQGWYRSWRFPIIALRNLSSNPLPAFADLKPFHRVVTRNGWQWIVARSKLFEEEAGEGSELFLIREDGKWAYIVWPGEQPDLDGAFEIVEVYTEPLWQHDMLDPKARGELLWTETSEKEAREKAKLVARLEQQHAELTARIEELRKQ